MDGSGMRPSNIVIILPYQYPIRESVIVDLFADVFQKNKHRVYIIALSQLHETYSEEMLGSGTQLYLIPSTTKYGILSYLFNTLQKFFGVLYFLNIIGKDNIDIIQTRNNIFDSCLALFLKIILKVKMYYFISSPPDLGYRIEAKNKNGIKRFLLNLRASWAKIMIHIIFLFADRVILQSKWMKQFYTTKGWAEERLLVVPMGISSRYVSQTLPDNYQQSNLIYVGTLNLVRDPLFLIRLAKSLKNRGLNLRVVIFGNGDATPIIKKQIENLGLAKYISVKGSIPRAELMKEISHSFVGLSPIPPNLFYRLSSPTKIVEYNSRGIPFIGNVEIPDHRDIIDRYGCGRSPKFDVGGFIDAILELKSSKEKYTQAQEMGYRFVMNERTYDKIYDLIKSNYFITKEVSHK